MSSRFTSACIVLVLSASALAASPTPAGASTGSTAPAVVGDCTAGSPSTGLTNMGFETGDLSSWTETAVTDSIAVTGADAFASPWEGSHMARLGSTYADDSEGQPAGPNEICQEFVVDSATEHFSYNIFTYDYTGFDEFEFNVEVVDPATGFVVVSSQTGAWGTGTALKTTGWRGIELDLTGHLGQTMQIRLSAGGTSDTLYGFWVYLDSAATMPTEPVALADVDTGSGSVMTDPTTGEVTIAQPFSSPSSITITAAVTCPDASTPSSVVLLLGGSSFPMTAVGGGSPNWTGTIPADSVESGTLSIQANCTSGPVIIVLGKVQLYDPSGYLTDKITGDPVVGADVTLYQVPGWTAATDPTDTGPTVCESNLSKDPADPWSQPAPTSLGVEANPYGGLIDPQVNPFITNQDGYYGWDVAAGCWYVVVTAEGYETLTSPVVGVPTEVTDLNLELMPDDLPSFSDVTESNTFYGDIMWMALEGVTTGFDDGTYRPLAQVTRQSMAAFLYRLAGSPDGPDPTCSSAPFTDIPVSHPFCGEIDWMVDTGVTTGFPDGSFHPGDPVLRRSMAAFLYRLAGSPDGPDPTCVSAPFNDVPVSNPFCGEITWMADTEITTGYDDGGFHPADPVLRQAMAAFLHRFQNLDI